MNGINWGLLNSRPGAMDHFQFGMTLGRDMRARNDEKAMKQGLAAYVNNPNDQTRAAVTEQDPMLGMKLQDREAQQAAAQQQAAREKTLMVAKLFDGVQDEATYQQRLQIAQRMGIDTAAAPPQFDPAWVQETGLIMRFIAEKPEAVSSFGKIALDEGLQPGTPQFAERVKQLVKADAMKTIPLQPGGAVIGYNTQTGQTTQIAAPYQGMGATAPKGLPRPQTEAEVKALPPGSQFMAPDGSVRTVPGGPARSAPGGFPAG
jgi:hypothetical protein